MKTSSQKIKSFSRQVESFWLYLGQPCLPCIFSLKVRRLQRLGLWASRLQGGPPWPWELQGRALKRPWTLGLQGGGLGLQEYKAALKDFNENAHKPPPAPGAPRRGCETAGGVAIPLAERATRSKPALPGLAMPTRPADLLKIALVPLGIVLLHVKYEGLVHSAKHCVV